MASSLLQNLHLLLLIFLTFIPLRCIAEEDHREIYLVLTEGDPVAFHHGNNMKLEKGKKLDPSCESLKAYAKKLTESHDELLEVSLDRGSYNKVYSFKHIVNGFAVHTTPSQVEKVKRLPGVRLVEKDRRVKLMTTYTPQFLDMASAWSQEGGDRNAGEGVVIGFVDSGINPLHPSFGYDPANPFSSKVSHFSGDCEAGPLFPKTACNGKIVSARFFSAGAQAAATLNASIDILSPFDADGHGSHVASTAAGNFGVPVVVDGFYYGTASGMAPRARIAVYKAIYPTVGVLSDVLAAIDQAVIDGVDILSLSVGPDEPPEEALTFLALFEIFMLAAHRAGVFVVQAAGNHGPGPYSVISYSPWSVGVAACDTDRSFPGTLILGDGHKISGIGLSGSTLGSGVLRHKLVLAKDAVRINGAFPRTAEYIEECQYPEALDPSVLIGSLVICSFSAGFSNGSSSLTAITETAKALGFAGFVFVANPSYGDFIAQPLPFQIPGIMIPRAADAQIILSYYEKQTARDKRGYVTRYGGSAAITEGRIASYTTRAPVVSRFSSRGPDFSDQTRNPTDVLKPDLLAPGNQIWAAWSPMSVADPILSGQNFALISGTSMATPHVAGVAALIRQQNPSWTPSMIASALSTTATTQDNLGETMMAQGSELYSLHTSAPFGFGSGLVNPSRALDPGLVFSAGFKDYIGFLCSLPNIDPEVVKTATGGICGGIFFEHPSDLNLPSVTISALAGSRLVHRRVLNVASKPESYLCAVLPPKGVAVDIQPSWFRIPPQGTQDLQIRFNVSLPSNDFCFGEVTCTGSLNHIMRIPLSVLPISASQTE
ncbi:subtilisin-like protease SBT2.4 [Ipomoea triloba]|uniref:subtilisin-like protease SBT2.4 n=1 Tax=Ipomoea triloba TaxID=35885 RepID=UPI00125E8D04|nr:subtilisin-like protease SBT2.4 [Ipomoea triloba]